MRQIINFLLIMFLLVACNKDQKVDVLEMPLESFSVLSINDRFDVVLTQGTDEHIKISGHPSLVKKVEFNIIDNELIISSKSSSAWLRPRNNRIKIELTVANLSRINVNETGSLICTNELTGDEIGLVTTGKLAEVDLNLNCTTFYFWNNFPCSGKITLKGQVHILKLWNNALMQVDAIDLLTDDSEIENNSKGDISTYTNNSIKYKINGEGNIRLKGNPPVLIPIESEGTGELIIL